jgi:phosphatidylethanolamine-binding protein (PEBP) family uncharacterized protein
MNFCDTPSKANKREGVMLLRVSIQSSILAASAALAALCGTCPANAQGVFTLTSPSFKDGERLAVKNAGNNKSNPNCVGENVSPALSWSNPPEGTKSFAILMFDPEGRPPGGVSHWVAYGIPASVTGFAEGEVSKPSDKYVGGSSLMKLPNYFGPCTCARNDPRRGDQGTRRSCQAGHRADRHFLQAMMLSSVACL